MSEVSQDNSSKKLKKDDDIRYSSLKLKNQLCFPIYTASRVVTSNYRRLLRRVKLTYTQYIISPVHTNVNIISCISISCGVKLLWRYRSASAFGLDAFVKPQKIQRIYCMSVLYDISRLGLHPLLGLICLYEYKNSVYLLYLPVLYDIIWMEDRLW